MKASEHTESMLAGWRAAYIDRADLAIKRKDGSMLWQRDRLLADLPLAWARAENVREAEVYIRPARTYSWGLVFLDDVAVDLAQATIRNYGGTAVQTSPAGGCHLWLPCQIAMDESLRHIAQRRLAKHLRSDPGSTSGEHLGRLAGFRNWKRGGCWVNVLGHVVSPPQALWDLLLALGIEDSQQDSEEVSRSNLVSNHLKSIGYDHSPSGREWGWVCRMLEGGIPQEQIYDELVRIVQIRRGSDSERYARRTIANALKKLGHSSE